MSDDIAQTLRNDLSLCRPFVRRNPLNLFAFYEKYQDICQISDFSVTKSILLFSIMTIHILSIDIFEHEINIFFFQKAA